MTDWTTMIATIQERNNKTLTEADRIQRQICDSIALHRRERLRWNQARFAITLTADVGTYVVSSPGSGEATGLPAALVAVHGRELDLDWSGDAEQRTPVTWISEAAMRSARRGGTVSGEPIWWSFWDEKLELYPPSDSSTHILRGSYIADVGTPTYTYNRGAGAWVFKDPAGNTITLTSTYTNPWFDQKQGFNLIAYHAEWQLWTGAWQGASGQDQRALTRYTEALAAAQEITSMQTMGRGQIAPYHG